MTPLSHCLGACEGVGRPDHQQCCRMLPEGQAEKCVASLLCYTGGRGCNQQGCAAACHLLCCTLGLLGMRVSGSQRQSAPTQQSSDRVFSACRSAVKWKVLVLLPTGTPLSVRAIHGQLSSLREAHQAVRRAFLLCRDAQERAAAAKAAADISSPKAAEAGATPAGKKGVKKGDKGSKAPEEAAAKANWQKWQESNVRWASALCSNTHSARTRACSSSHSLAQTQLAVHLDCMS